MKFRAVATCAALIAGFFSPAMLQPTRAQSPLELRLVFDIPMNHPRVPYFTQMASDVEGKSSGRLKVVVNPGGRIHPGFASIQALSKGEADISFVNASNLETLDPKFGFINLPFSLDDVTMEKPAERAAVVDLLDDLAKPHGLRALGMMRGADQLFVFSNKAPARLGDLAGLKIRVAGPGIYEDIMRRLAIQPVVLPIPQMKPAFERGALEGVFTSPGAWSSQLGMAAPNAIRIPGLMMITYVMLARAEVVERLSGQDRAVLVEAARHHITDGWNRMREDDDGILKDMATKGAKIVRVDDLAPWRSAVAPIAADYARHHPATAQRIKSVLDRAAR